MASGGRITVNVRTDTPEAWAIIARLMELWQQPWSEPAYGEAQMLLSRLGDDRPVPTHATNECAVCGVIGVGAFVLCGAHVPRHDSRYAASLDVERLAEAMRPVTRSLSTGGHEKWLRDTAAAIAREYAALTPTGDTPKGEE